MQIQNGIAGFGTRGDTPPARDSLDRIRLIGDVRSAANLLHERIVSTAPCEPTQFALVRREQPSQCRAGRRVRRDKRTPDLYWFRHDAHSRGRAERLPNDDDTLLLLVFMDEAPVLIASRFRKD